MGHFILPRDFFYRFFSLLCDSVMQYCVATPLRFDRLPIYREKSVNPLNVNVGPSVTKNVVGAVKKT